MHVSIVSQTFHHQKTKVGITFFSNLLRESLTDPNPAMSALQTKGHTFFCKGELDLKDTSTHTALSGSPSRRGATVGVNSGFYFPILSFRPALHLPSLAPGGCGQRHLSAGGENDID